MPVDIEIASASLENVPRNSFIKINGEVKVDTGRSYAIVMLDSNWNYVEYKKYDVYGSTSARDSMVSYLNGLSSDTIVLLSTNDEPQGNLEGNLANALKDLGATSASLNQIAYRGSYILVGRKGVGEGNNYFEKVGPRGAEFPSIYYNSSF
jgi:hypothetical protein